MIEVQNRLQHYRRTLLFALVLLVGTGWSTRVGDAAEPTVASIEIGSTSACWDCAVQVGPTLPGEVPNQTCYDLSGIPGAIGETVCFQEHWPDGSSTCMLVGIHCIIPMEEDFNIAGVRESSNPVSGWETVVTMPNGDQALFNCKGMELSRVYTADNLEAVENSLKVLRL